MRSSWIDNTDDTKNTVTKLVNEADDVIATWSQEQVDQLCEALNVAVKELEHKEISQVDESISKIKEFRRVPANYRSAESYPDAYKGTIVREKYSTYLYDSNDIPGDPVEKDMLVYLPAGYDQNDIETKYNVLYLIHGTAEDQNTVFGDVGETTELKKILDLMIANGDIEPMIVVTPTWYELGSVPFHNEIINEIIPLIESKYNTYAESGSQKDLRAARAHRAIGGFSQGSSCIWNIMEKHFDYFKYYVPLSGGPGERDFATMVKEYNMDDYYVFAATGSDDITYSGMKDSIPAMGNLDGIFNYNADLTKGNLYFLCLPGGTHTWQCNNQYLYNILPDLFFKENAKSTDSGLDENDRLVAAYGSPKVDGIVDEVWEKATTIRPTYVGDDVIAKPTFKVLWDDKALYILAQVRDIDQSVDASSAYEQDSMEIFMDENHDATKQYGIDDLHLRVNIHNEKTTDAGDLDRLYTSVKQYGSRYVIEARVALNNTPVNGDVLGIDLQINDAQGASRLGTANIFDSTGGAWNDTALFGDLKFIGRPDDAKPIINPYVLLNAIEKAAKLDPTEYANPEDLASAIDKANEVAQKEDATQTELDQAIIDLHNEITALEYTDEAKKVKRFTPMPDMYKVPVTVPDGLSGSSIVTLPYTTDLAGNGNLHDEKYVNVYLPAGYNPDNPSRSYDVYYLSHGGGENTDTIFKNVPEGQSPELKNILDHMIQEGKIQPMIVVTPTFYASNGENDISKFDKELVTDIVPLVEGTFNTYAKAEALEHASFATGSVVEISPDDMKQTRGHRAFGGFSMGGMMTWYVLQHQLDYFKYFTPYCGPLSEDVAQAVRDAGYSKEDVYVFAADGSKDPTYLGMGPQMDELKKQTDVFVYNQEIKEGNFYFVVADGGTHAWGWVNQYIYNIIPDLFDRD